MLSTPARSEVTWIVWNTFRTLFTTYWSKASRPPLGRDGLDNQREGRRVIVFADSGIDDIRKVPEDLLVRRMKPERLNKYSQNHLCEYASEHLPAPRI